MSFSVLLGLPACSDTNSPNTTGQSQPTTMGQQAPNTTVQQTPSAEPQHPTTIGQGPGAGTVGVAPTASAQDFARTVAMSDMFEIQASQLALAKDPDADTKPFAQRMVQDHQTTPQALQALADSGKVKCTLPTAL